MLKLNVPFNNDNLIQQILLLSEDSEIHINLESKTFVADGFEERSGVLCHAGYCEVVVSRHGKVYSVVTNGHVNINLSMPFQMCVDFLLQFCQIYQNNEWNGLYFDNWYVC